MKTKAKYRFIEFIRPDSYWPHPYTIEQAFGVFRWLLQTGEGYRDVGTWGVHDIRSLLSCKPTCVNFQAIEPIRSVSELRRRFHYAILSSYGGPQLELWRKKYHVTPDGVAVISFPHLAWREIGGGGWGEAATAIDALLNAQGRLGVQLNSYHSRAREIVGVSLHCRTTYEFVLDYGYGGSVWHHTLSRQLPRETFVAAFRRAQRKLLELIDGKKPAAEVA